MEYWKCFMSKELLTGFFSQIVYPEPISKGVAYIIAW